MAAIYVIDMVMQMGSRFKKTVISENVRRSLHGWQRRAKTKQHGSSTPLLTEMSVASLDSLVDGDDVDRMSGSPAQTHDVEPMSSSVQEDISVAPRGSGASSEEDHDLQLEDDDSADRVHHYPLFDGQSSEREDSDCGEL